jgi:hypothetical protein
VTKIVRFTKNDLIMGICYGIDEIAGFEDRIADNLIKKEYAVLYGDGRPRPVGHRIPDDIGSGYWAGEEVAKKLTEMKQRA